MHSNAQESWSIPSFRHLGRHRWQVIAMQVIVLGWLLGVIPGGFGVDAHALSVGQRVRFSYSLRGRTVTKIGQVLAVSGRQVRVRYSASGQMLSRWVSRSRVTGLSGTGNMVHTCRANDKILYTRSGRKVCCPRYSTPYHTRSGGDIICCPAGTTGVYSGQHHVICRKGSQYRPSNGRTYTPPRGRPYRRKARFCANGTTYRAQSGRSFCCPAGTVGYQNGYNGIRCKPRTSGTVFGRRRNSGSSKCPPITRKNCRRNTIWKCYAFKLSDGTQCQKCGCHFR